MPATAQQMQQLQGALRGGGATAAGSSTIAPISSGVHTDWSKEFSSVPIAPIPVISSDPGFLGNLVRPAATMIARPVQALQGIGDYIGTRMEQTGTSEQQNAVLNAEKQRNDANEKETGSVIAPTPKGGTDFVNKDVMKDVGRGMETVAMGMPGLKTAGAMFGAGTSLEQGHDLLSLNTAFQTALGTAAGPLFGLLGKPVFNIAGKVIDKITPEFLQNLAGKGTKAIQDFAAQHEILPQPISNMINKGAQGTEDMLNKTFNVPTDMAKNKLAEMKSARIPGAIDDLEKSFDDIATGRKGTLKAMNRSDDATIGKNKAGTEGKRPQRVLAEAGVIPEHDNMTFTTHAQAERIRSDVSHLSNANQKALGLVEQQTQPILTKDLISDATKMINANVKTDAGRKTFIAQAERDLSGMGESVPITVLDAEKSGQWDKVKFDSAVSQDKRDYHYYMAKAMQKRIEQTAKDAGLTEIAQLNREIGDQLEAAKFLESLNGNKVLNGQMGKHFLRLSGAIIGGSTGGPLASVFGAMGGEVVSRMLATNSIASPINRLLLRDLEARDPVAYGKVIGWIKQQGLDSENRVMTGMLLKEGDSSQIPLPMGSGPDKSGVGDVIGNNFRQNMSIDRNILKLPPPSKAIITPNTGGTPNLVNAPYLGGGEPESIGGLRTRNPIGN